MKLFGEWDTLEEMAEEVKVPDLIKTVLSTFSDRVMEITQHRWTDPYNAWLNEGNKPISVIPDWRVVYREARPHVSNGIAFAEDVYLILVPEDDVKKETERRKRDLGLS